MLLTIFNLTLEGLQKVLKTHGDYLTYGEMDFEDDTITVTLKDDGWSVLSNESGVLILGISVDKALILDNKEYKYVLVD